MLPFKKNGPNVHVRIYQCFKRSMKNSLSSLASQFYSPSAHWAYKHHSVCSC